MTDELDDHQKYIAAKIELEDINKTIAEKLQKYEEIEKEMGDVIKMTQVAHTEMKKEVAAKKNLEDIQATKKIELGKIESNSKVWLTVRTGLFHDLNSLHKEYTKNREKRLEKFSALRVKIEDINNRYSFLKKMQDSKDSQEQVNTELIPTKIIPAEEINKLNADMKILKTDYETKQIPKKTELDNKRVGNAAERKLVKPLERGLKLLEHQIDIQQKKIDCINTHLTYLYAEIKKCTVNQNEILSDLDLLDVRMTEEQAFIDQNINVLVTHSEFI